MADKRMSASEIEAVLLKEKLEASIDITVDTLKYLKKGGGTTPAAAALETEFEFEAGTSNSRCEVRFFC